MHRPSFDDTCVEIVAVLVLIGEGFKESIIFWAPRRCSVAVLVLIGEGFKAYSGPKFNASFAFVAVLVLIGEGFKELF